MLMKTEILNRGRPKLFMLVDVRGSHARGAKHLHLIDFWLSSKKQKNCVLEHVQLFCILPQLPTAALSVHNGLTPPAK